MISTLDIIGHFSNLTVSPLGSMTAINGFVPPEEYAAEYIVRTINNMFEYKEKEPDRPINTILLDSCLRTFLKNDQSISDLMEMINKTLRTNAQSIYQSIQTMIYDGAIASSDVSEMRINYCKTVRKLGYVFRIIRENICSKSFVQNPFFKGDQMFVILGDLIFFKEAVQKKYLYKGSDEYLFKILFLNTDHHQINQLTCLHKLCIQYNAFSRSIKSNHSDDQNIREKLFDQQLDPVIASMVISRDATLQYVDHIDMMIRSLAQQLNHLNTNDELDEQYIYKMVSDLTANIVMLQKFGDSDVFMFGYHEKLRNRLFEKKSNLNLEQKIAQTLKFNTSPETYVAINYSINDMMGAEFINNEFRHIQINSTSGIYDELEMKEFDRSKSWFDVLRRHVWAGMASEHTDSYKSLCAPKQISIYSDTFKKFYDQYFSKKYTSNSSRRIDYLYDRCMVELDIRINQTWYDVRGNFIQTSILLYCAANPNGLTYNELSDLLNLPIDQFRTHLNQLFLSGLIIYGRSIDNPTNRLRINHDFEKKTNKTILLECESSESNSIDLQLILIYMSNTPNQTLEQINKYFGADCSYQLKQLMDDDVVSYCDQQFTLSIDMTEFDQEDPTDDEEDEEDEEDDTVDILSSHNQVNTINHISDILNGGYSLGGDGDAADFSDISDSDDALDPEAVPLEAVSSEAVPLEAVSSEAVPLEAVSSEAVSLEAVPSEAVSLEAVPSEAVSLEAVPLEAVPLEAVPLEAVSLEAVPSEADDTDPFHTKENNDIHPPDQSNINILNDGCPLEGDGADFSDITDDDDSENED